jgi:hypothetical protein
MPLGDAMTSDVVIPAQAGIQRLKCAVEIESHWIPACAGMTTRYV